MSKRKSILLGGLALVLLAVTGLVLGGFGATAVSAQTAPTPTTGMMGGWSGQGTPGGMMGGTYGQGMMGGWNAQNPQAQAIDLKQAIASVQAYVGRAGNQDLVVDEVLEFQYNFYAIVKEKSTGNGAYELLVNKYGGAVYPEMGPNLMWNTKYGMWGNGQGFQGMMGGGMMGGYGSGGWGIMGGGMMGGNGWGMMGGQYGNGTVSPSGQPTVSLEDARKTAQKWLDRYQPGSGTETPDQFYGYYTVHIVQKDQPTGMLSVNAYTGQVWYHNWHGKFIGEQEVG